jgi:sortase B
MNKNNTNNYEDYDTPIKDNITIYSSIKKKKKRTLKLWVWLLIFFIFLSTTIMSTIKLLKWHNSNLETNDNIKDINTNYEEIKDSENTEYINKPDNKEDDYYYFIKFPLINVNFSELQKKNSDTIAWINVNNTNINYPIVQTTNNNYYLTHSFNKKENEAGWVFMDYRNNQDFTDKNTIIYAHSRLNKTMFGSLSKVLKESWYKNKDNYIIRISTPTENSSWQIFSVYKIKTETYYLTTNFINNNDYEKFLITLKNRSKYNFNTNISIQDEILTLSTCYSDTERTVVHAKLIKKEKR